MLDGLSVLGIILFYEGLEDLLVSVQLSVFLPVEVCRPKLPCGMDGNILQI